MRCRVTSGPDTGKEIEHPKAFRLVQIGIAEPLDDECAERAGRKVQNADDEVDQAAADLPDKLEGSK